MAMGMGRGAWSRERRDKGEASLLFALRSLLRFLVLGSWFLVRRSWFLVLGSWFLVLGSWFLVLGAPFLVLGAPCVFSFYHWSQSFVAIGSIASEGLPRFD